MKRVEEIIIGDDHDIPIVIVDKNNAPIDVTGQTIYFTVRRFPGQTPLLSKDSVTNPEFVEVTEPTLGEVSLHLTSANTSLFTPGRWTYVVKRVGSGKTYTVGQSDIWAYNDTDNWSWIDIRDYILQSLGAGVITVELTKEQIEACIKAAMTEYSRLLPLKLSNSLNVPSQGRVDLTPYGYGRGVVDVQPQGRMFLDTGFGFPYPISQLAAGAASTSLVKPGELEETLGYIEMTLRVTGTEFEWLWEKPYLYVQNIPDGINRLTYVIADNHIIQTIPEIDQEWVNKFALAKAKKIVGEFRGKYGQVATPGGGTSLNGPELKQEGAAEEAQLLEELRKKLPDEPFMFG